jgi:hypothetical protein
MTALWKESGASPTVDDHELARKQGGLRKFSQTETKVIEYLMSLEQLEETVLKLPREERRRFLEWLYEHEDELIGDDDDIHPEVKAEILRRREEALAHPEKLEAWESAFPRMKQRFDELRRKNPYARQ